jgi:hypothetical protein
LVHLTNYNESSFVLAQFLIVILNSSFMIFEKTFLYTVIILLTTSCYREETITPPVCNECTKPVVLCFINPGDSIKAYVAFTQLFGKTPIPNSENAPKLTLSDTTGKTIELLPAATNNNYYVASQTNFKINTGALYTLKLITNDGLSCQASTRVPANRDTWYSAQIIGTQLEDEMYNLYLIKLDWTKHQGNKNLISNKTSTDNVTNTILEFDFKEINTTTYNYEYVFKQFWRNKYFFTLYTINKPTEEYLKSYSIFNDISLEMSTTTLTDVYNGIIPEYTNFDKCLGVFGAFLTDTISVTNLDTDSF